MAKKRGRPPKRWTASEQSVFEGLCATLCTKREIANALNMDPHTLDANIAEFYPESPTWEEAFERFSSVTRAALRKAQIDAAKAGDRTMLIWLGKQYLGQSDDPKRQREEEAARGELYKFRGKALPSKKAAGQ